MIEAHISERMPDVARGRAAWTPNEASHLEGCAECTAEWHLVRQVAGREPTVALDVDGLAARVVARLRGTQTVVSPGSHRGWRRWAIGLAAAASIALAVAIWRPWPSGSAPVAMVPSRERTMLPELDALLEAELEVVLATIEPATAVPLGSVPRIGDLTDEELELLLEEVEG
jgi:hypothetical protein